MNPSVIYFVLFSVVWINTIRFVVFRFTDTVVAPSALYGATVFLFLLFSTITTRRLSPLRSEKLKIIVALLLVFVSFLIAKMTMAQLSEKDLATAWSYFIFPALCMLVGVLLQPREVKDARSQTLIWFVYLTTAIFILGLTINMVDVATKGEMVEELYRGFATTASAYVGEFRMPRVTGQFFSSIDLALATLILIAVRRGVGIGSRLIDYCLLVPLIFTFTRNVYVLLILMFVFQRLVVPNRNIFLLAFLIGAGLTIYSAIHLGSQIISGEIEATDELSSIITRISSWLSLTQDLLASPVKMVFGIGYSQNYFGESVVDVYAIDNVYFEILSLGGGLAVLSYVGYCLMCIRLARHGSKEMGRFMASFICSVPIFGVFNNVFGWSMFSIMLAFVFAFPSTRKVAW